MNDKRWLLTWAVYKAPWWMKPMMNAIYKRRNRETPQVQTVVAVKTDKCAWWSCATYPEGCGGCEHRRVYPHVKQLA